MTKKEALEILIKHQVWRKGADVDMINPATLSEAIDTAIKYLKK